MNSSIFAEKSLFIFDMDGTMTDTEPLHYESYRRTLAELFPEFQLTEEEFRDCYVGHSETDIYGLLKKKHAFAFDDDWFFARRQEQLFACVQERCLTTVPFYRQLMGLYPGTRAVMLTSQRPQVLARFRKLVDFGGWLSEYISVAGQPAGKPERLRDPEKYFGCPAEKIMIFEDYAPTLACAKENGIYAVGVQHRFNHLPEGCCDTVIDISREISFT